MILSFGSNSDDFLTREPDNQRLRCGLESSPVERILLCITGWFLARYDSVEAVKFTLNKSPAYSCSSV
jgi:hypothetical protein